jgi:hypothetical protein
VQKYDQKFLENWVEEGNGKYRKWERIVFVLSIIIFAICCCTPRLSLKNQLNQLLLILFSCGILAPFGYAFGRLLSEKNKIQSQIILGQIEILKRLDK